jgi:hypothetical protein
MGTYAVLAFLANWNAWSAGATRVLQPSQDPKLDAWYVAWTPFALTHGANPFFSHWVNVPFGANFAANVAIPLLSLIASPVTAIWGPVAGVNFLTSFAFFACCVGGYFFVRHWTRWRPAAFVGGLLYGFSPYVVSEGIAHLHTMFVALVPFIFIVLDEIFVRQRYSRRLLGLALGGLVVAQYFISSEVLATTAILALIVGVLVALFNLDRVREHVLGALPAVALGLGLAVVVLAFPIAYSQLGPEHYTLTITVGQYQSDLLSAVLPSSNQLISPSGATAISDHFANNLSENGSYLGIPLVILLIGTTVVCRRSKVVVISFLAACSAYLLALGSPLLVDNSYVGWAHLPAGIFHHLPLLKGAVMARFSVFVVLFATLVVGIALERMRRWPGWPTAWAGGAVAIVVSAAALVPLIPALPYAEAAIDTPAFFTTSAVDSVPAGSVAVVYPSTNPVDADSTLWQAAAGMRFKMPGAYALVPAPGALQSQWGTPTLTSNTLGAIAGNIKVAESPSLRRALRAQWLKWDAETFIMGPGPDEAYARQFVSWVTGKPPVHRQGVSVWYHLRDDLLSP